MSEENTEVEEKPDPIKLNRFELPSRLIKNEDTATDKFAQFTAEPF